MTPEKAANGPLKAVVTAAMEGGGNDCSMGMTTLLSEITENLADSTRQSLCSPFILVVGIFICAHAQPWAAIQVYAAYWIRFGRRARNGYLFATFSAKVMKESLARRVRQKFKAALVATAIWDSFGRVVSGILSAVGLVSKVVSDGHWHHRVIG
ncbi:hypothetical protein GGR51DRAFT_559878 [Nemania sp. FL0031]|nr:hypothetical protein GGR51DRAFT_559878 [Nemania sp. FL0031]